MQNLPEFPSVIESFRAGILEMPDGENRIVLRMSHTPVRATGPSTETVDFLFRPDDFRQFVEDLNKLL